MSIRPRSLSPSVLASLVLAATLLALPAWGQDTGSADFSRFVTLGDSLGAAFASGSLVRGAQEDSVSALIARQVGLQPIEQPLVSEPGIPAVLQLQSLSPLVIAPLPGFGQPLNATLQRPYDNLSVPGFRLGDALRNRERPDASFARLVLRAPATQLEQALSLQPTFALVWLGNNDVLAAAVSGVVIERATITPVDQFESDYVTLVGALKAAGADLALATLPDVTSIPFVTTIPPVLIHPVTRQPILGPNGQPIPLIGPDGLLGPNDRVLLPVSSKIAQGIGVPTFAGGTGQPLENSDVLSASEIATIQARVDAFNNIIRAVAAQTDSALADINGLLRQAATGGFNIGGITFTADFLSGGTFSLDGVHPAPLGYAVAANEFIRAINATYDADIPPVDLFPFIFGDERSPLDASLGAEWVFSEAAYQQLADSLRVWQPASPGGGKKPAKRIDGPWKLPPRPKG